MQPQGENEGIINEEADKQEAGLTKVELGAYYVLPRKSAGEEASDRRVMVVKLDAIMHLAL